MASHSLVGYSAATLVQGTPGDAGPDKIKCGRPVKRQFPSVVTQVLRSLPRYISGKPRHKKTVRFRHRAPNPHWSATMRTAEGSLRWRRTSGTSHILEVAGFSHIHGTPAAFKASTTSSVMRKALLPS